MNAAAALGLAPPLRHIAATAGAIDLPEARLGCVRLGIGIYGLSPFDDEGSVALGLRPAMELSAIVVSVKRVPAGSGVGRALMHNLEGWLRVRGVRNAHLNSTRTAPNTFRSKSAAKSTAKFKREVNNYLKK